MNRVAAKSSKVMPYIRYSEDFKQKALKLLNEGKTLAAVASELSVSVPTLISWKKAQNRAGIANVVDPTNEKLSAAEEISRLKFELAKVTEERDRLRQSMAYLIGAQVPR